MHAQRALLILLAVGSPRSVSDQDPCTVTTNWLQRVTICGVRRSRFGLFIPRSASGLAEIIDRAHPVPGSPQSRVERGHASDSNPRRLLSSPDSCLFETRSLRAGVVLENAGPPPNWLNWGAVATRQSSRKVEGQPPDAMVKESTHSPSLSTYSAPRGLRQDPGRAAESQAEATTPETGVATCVGWCRRMARAGMTTTAKRAQ
jgi:hypothetical protein